MKLAIAAAFLAFWVAGLARAQDGPIQTCERWNTLYDNSTQTSIILGWVLATAMMSNGDDFWPRGHRVGSVQLEVNVICQKPGNQTLKLPEVFLMVVRDKNGR
jgi:hypothetical protein